MPLLTNKKRDLANGAGSKVYIKKGGLVYYNTLPMLEDCNGNVPIVLQMFIPGNIRHVHSHFSSF